MHIHHSDISIHLEDELLLDSLGDHHQEDGVIVVVVCGVRDLPWIDVQ